MRNSSKLINTEENLKRAQESLLEFNRIIALNKGPTKAAQTTGDGHLLIYDRDDFISKYTIINRLLYKIQKFIIDLDKRHPDLKLGYGIGMQKSKVTILAEEVEHDDITLYIGQSVNTSSKYAYYHNRTSLGHHNYEFDGILTTITINNLLKENGFKTGLKLPKSSGFEAVKLTKLVRDGESQ